MSLEGVFDLLSFGIMITLLQIRSISISVENYRGICLFFLNI